MERKTKLVNIPIKITVIAKLILEPLESLQIFIVTNVTQMN